MTDIVTEKELMADIVGLAKRAGWRYYHTHRSDKSPEGFPDLVLVKGKRLIVAELKREQAKPTPAQRAWLDDLAGVPGVEAYIWRPQDRNEYEEVLST